MRRSRGAGSAAVRRRVLLQTTAVLAAGAGMLGVLQLSAGAAARTPGPAQYRWDLPEGFPKPRVPKDNPMSVAKAEAGRRLFYDDRLSGNGTQSCASCHQLSRAFADGRATTVGSTGQVGPRNAPSLLNSAFNQTLGWANPSLRTLERQMHVPLFGERPVELGVTDRNRTQVLRRIARDPWYQAQFEKAFPRHRRPITWTTIVRSIATFQRALVSADSKYDRYRLGRAKLTASEKRGMVLFSGEKAECHHCHGTFIFSDQATYEGAPEAPPQFHNTGLFNIGGTGAYPADNIGLAEITGKASDMGRFRAPSLRNVELTAPYMHDGSILTLAEVVATYAAGGRTITEGPNAGDGRTSRFKDPLIGRIDLTDQDQRDLVAFLMALTDRSIETNPRFQDPFRRRR